MGRERARLLWELSERALDAIQELAGDDLRRVGSLRLAADEAERDELEAEHEALREDGFAAEWHDALAPPLDRRYHGALLHPGDGAVHPARWVRRLAARAAASGAEIAEGSRVELAQLEAEADAVVVAVDGLVARALPEYEGLVRPVRGQMVATAPLTERLFERPHYARRGFDYWQQLADGRLVVGGRRDGSLETEYTDVEETTDAVQARLEALLGELLAAPQPAITHRWAGIWGETPDSLPLAGQVPGRDGVWVAGGYSGHGNVLGYACGDLVARAIAGERAPELELFDPSRLTPTAVEATPRTAAAAEAGSHPATGRDG
jgi:glycine/D-amino acid oxidase-like deaminating enzyme